MLDANILLLNVGTKQRMKEEPNIALLHILLFTLKQCGQIISLSLNDSKIQQ